MKSNLIEIARLLFLGLKKDHKNEFKTITIDANLNPQGDTVYPITKIKTDASNGIMRKVTDRLAQIVESGIPFTFDNTYAQQGVIMVKLDPVSATVDDFLESKKVTIRQKVETLFLKPKASASLTTAVVTATAGTERLEVKAGDPSDVSEITNTPVLVLDEKTQLTIKEGMKELLNSCGAKAGTSNPGNHFHTVRCVGTDERVLVELYCNTPEQAARTIDFFAAIDVEPHMGRKTATSIKAYLTTDPRGKFTEALKEFFPPVAENLGTGDKSKRKGKTNLVAAPELVVVPEDGTVTALRTLIAQLSPENKLVLLNGAFKDLLPDETALRSKICNEERVRLRTLMIKSFKEGGYAIIKTTTDPEGEVVVEQIPLASII